MHGWKPMGSQENKGSFYFLTEAGSLAPICAAHRTKCWDYSHMPSIYGVLGIEPGTLRVLDKHSTN